LFRIFGIPQVFSWLDALRRLLQTQGAIRRQAHIPEYRVHGHEKADQRTVGDCPGVVAGVTAVGCFAHIRRKFFEAFESAGKRGESGQMLALIKELLTIEQKLRDQLDRG
jgi:hypothetical protein